jgi:hypothetical protein
MRNLRHILAHALLALATQACISDDSPAFPPTTKGDGSVLQAEDPDTSRVAPSLDASIGASCMDASGESCLLDCRFGDSCGNSDGGQPPELASALREWQGRCPQGATRTFPRLSEATCADGTRALELALGRGVERRFFDANGKFLAVEMEGDFIDPICAGIRYWPKRVVCDSPVVTKVHCGPAATGDGGLPR